MREVLDANPEAATTMLSEVLNLPLKKRRELQKS